MQQQGKVNHCKVQYGNEFRRFNYQHTDYAALVKQIATVYGFKNAEEIVVKYKDDEGDMVTISSNEELEFAIDAFAGSIIRLTVSLNNQDSSAEASHPRCPRWGFHAFGRPGPHFGHHFGPHFGHHFGHHFGPHFGPHHFGPHFAWAHGACGGRKGGKCGKEGRGAEWRERLFNKMKENPELISKRIDMLTKKRDLLKTRLEWLQNKDTSSPRKEQRINRITMKLNWIENRLTRLQAFAANPDTFNFSDFQQDAPFGFKMGRCGGHKGRMGKCGKEGKGAEWREQWINKIKSNPELLSRKIDMLTKKRDLLKTRLEWLESDATNAPQKEHRKNHITKKLTRVENMLARLQSTENTPAEPIVTPNQQTNAKPVTKFALKEALLLEREKREALAKAFIESKKEMFAMKKEIKALREQSPLSSENKARIQELKAKLLNHRSMHHQKKSELQVQDATIKNLRSQIQNLKQGNQ